MRFPPQKCTMLHVFSLTHQVIETEQDLPHQKVKLSLFRLTRQAGLRPFCCTLDSRLNLAKAPEVCLLHLQHQ